LLCTVAVIAAAGMCYPHRKVVSVGRVLILMAAFTIEAHDVPPFRFRTRL
jgi:hypothetical protein